ncbi:bis(5'-nucleosyl)-tetraphosphatase (symmetrical) YqeK [bacterium 210820-DFI.6.52]|nr:bis(5'-nucleosyl)-tetraphosphatase (symmetrical) YqeK [bacterium 210820-DFI.6.52]
MNPYKPYREYAKAHLSDERYRHTKNVVEQAGALARRHGADEDVCLRAAWLHDCMKEESLDTLLHWCREFAIINNALARSSRALLHGPAAAAFAREHFGVTDARVLDAIFYHTTGRPNMSAEEEIVFLADMTGPERTFAGVEQLRQLCFTDLNRAMAWALQNNLLYLAQRGRPIFEGSVTAYNHYIKGE